MRWNVYIVELDSHSGAAHTEAHLAVLDSILAREQERAMDWREKRVEVALARARYELAAARLEMFPPPRELAPGA